MAILLYEVPEIGYLKLAIAFLWMAGVNLTARRILRGRR